MDHGFDEAHDVLDREEIASNYTASPMPGRNGLLSRDMDRGNTPPEGLTDEESSYNEDEQQGINVRQQLNPHDFGSTAEQDNQSDDGTVSGSESMDSSSEHSDVELRMEGAYDPSEYEHLPVGSDIKELFGYISRYEPQIQELETQLRPFIPEYIPAVGDIDAFIKIPRPDQRETSLGLDVVDEPSAAQSDSTLLDIHIRQIDKTAISKAVAVKSVEAAEDNPRAVESWINSISELHRQKPPQSVHYSKAMPDIETLMQEWPAEFEEALNNTELPSADLDVSLKEYVDIICALLDIPVHKSRVQSLHLLFTLYSEFKSSQHFKSLEEKNNDPEEA